MKQKWIVEHRREVLTLGDFEITVQGDHYNKWAFSCKGLSISGADLTSKHFADAKDEALGIVAEEALGIVADEAQARVTRYRELRERALLALHGAGAEAEPVQQ